MQQFAGNKTSPKVGGRANKAIIQRPFRALILVAARNSDESQPESLMDLLNDAGLPVIDIYFNNHHLDEYEVKQRALHARKKQITTYFQVQLLRPSMSEANKENRLVRRVRGFLSKHAKGVEIDAP